MYSIEIVHGNNVVVPNVEVKYKGYSTLVYERVINDYLPGGFDEWEVLRTFGGQITYFNKKTGEEAFCQLLKDGIPVNDFDYDDRPHKQSTFTVFGGGRVIECNSASDVAHSIVSMIFNNLRHPTPVHVAV